MAVCNVCGAKLGFKKVMLKGMQYACYDCVKKAGYNPLTWMGSLKTSVADIQARIGLEPMPEMTVTQSIGNIFMIDGRNGLWYAQNQFGTRRGAVHRFSDIISYELLEDGDTQTKGGFGSTADEIRKFKALMDDGIITPEEFEAKKKQLLGL